LAGLTRFFSNYCRTFFHDGNTIAGKL